ncbi:hypothetical protein T265_10858 [Opisthorchis viverrini]|uniref:Uncharacterized protein n=1 Tax=Opisthorchis viverrini TaxID=6198 RepID=A0A074ZBT3_OPIVI|nr:hypothetical protein T265_10858 [Opisthorchis viverrini]KER20650.1 hypothetical protein T265_10858 [Opisthorchis viverrini]
MEVDDSIQGLCYVDAPKPSCPEHTEIDSRRTAMSSDITCNKQPNTIAPPLVQNVPSGKKFGQCWKTANKRNKRCHSNRPDSFEIGCATQLGHMFVSQTVFPCAKGNQPKAEDVGLSDVPVGGRVCSRSGDQATSDVAQTQGKKRRLVV